MSKLHLICLKNPPDQEVVEEKEVETEAEVEAGQKRQAVLRLQEEDRKQFREM